ncbi:MAG: DUF962 domain-containing protein [Gammaproteobacteria bacterium]
MQQQAIARPVDRFFDAYSADHRDATNQLLHVLCVPAIVWSLLALVYCIPLGEGAPTGLLAAVLAVVAVAFWCWLSLPLGLGAGVAMALSFWSVAALHAVLGSGGLPVVGTVVFVVAWVGQFIGHHIEGRRPSFFTDFVYLMIGPVWVLAKAYRKGSLAY